MHGELIKINTPTIMPAHKRAAMDAMIEQSDELDTAIFLSSYPEYLHWEKLKYKKWIPRFLQPVEFWALIKFLRMRGIPTPIIDQQGKPFTWNSFPHYERLLHELDLNMGGRAIGLHTTFSKEERRSHITRSLIEEAIASAQLEGAHTTREVAKKMIEEGRIPQDKGQKMILNNFTAMQEIEESYKNDPMSMELLLQLHTVLTSNTLDNPDQVGQLRTYDENVYVGSDDGQHISYIAPPLDFAKEQLERFIEYANNTLAENHTTFTHPVIKAILLHFWIGFLHPFADGNGRLARAVFYWYLLKQDYWAFSFIPVSTRIKKSPKQYSNAYIYSEQDSNDLTYFIDYNLRKISLARRDFTQYIEKKTIEHANFKNLEDIFPDFNHRQLSLIKYLHARPKERTNITSMQNIYGTSIATSANDLQLLTRQGFLRKQRRGKNIFYYPTQKLFDTLKSAQ